MVELIHIDLFSGVGGFAKGFQDAGIRFSHHYYSEIDRHSIAVYKYQFKESKYVGSVTDVSGRQLREKHPGGKFIVTFGFPCQDLSIAGKGEGLRGKRSGLFFEAIRIIEELGDRCEVFIFENVKGLLSCNEGKDFEIVLRTIADLGVYECEWQLVNTTWVLPQNRERIYFIGHLGGRSKPRVFPFRESDSIFTKSKRRKNREREVCSTITKNYHKGIHNQGETYVIQKTRGDCTTVKKDITGTLQGGGSNVMDKVPNVIQINPSKESNSNQPQQQNRVYSEEGIMPALTGELEGRNNVQTEVMISRPHGYNKGGEKKLPCLKSSSFEHNEFLKQGSTIRRLTEVECERLQGFPDGWTAWGDYDGEIKKVSKTQRYKQMGNAVTVDWPRMIANRLFN